VNCYTNRWRRLQVTCELGHVRVASSNDTWKYRRFVLIDFASHNSHRLTASLELEYRFPSSFMDGESLRIGRGVNLFSSEPCITEQRINGSNFSQF